LLKLKDKNRLVLAEAIEVDLYGSLSLTGKGHATDLACILGLTNADPETCAIEETPEIIAHITNQKVLQLDGVHLVKFYPKTQINFHRNSLPFHPNGIRFKATLNNGKVVFETYFSIGGGFIVQKERKRSARQVALFECFPRPIEKASELLAYCERDNKTVSQVVLENEEYLHEPDEINKRFKEIWDVMLDSMCIGCHTQGILPGGLRA
jgi:L-serine dehydratase